MAVSPVGRVVAVGSGDAILLHDWVAASRLPRSPTTAQVQAMEFSLDGSLLATGDAQGGIELWKPTCFDDVNKSDPAATTEPPKPADDRTAPPTTSSQSFPSSVNEQGFASLFDGKTLDGWHARSAPGRWTVEDGAIVGRLQTRGTVISRASCYEQRVLGFRPENEMQIPWQQRGLYSKSEGGWAGMMGLQVDLYPPDYVGSLEFFHEKQQGSDLVGTTCNGPFN